MIEDFVKNKKTVTKLSSARLINPIPNFKPTAKIFRIPVITTKRGLGKISKCLLIYESYYITHIIIIIV